VGERNRHGAFVRLRRSGGHRFVPRGVPIFNQTEWKLQPMFVDTNPFLFSGKVCGAMVRLSNSPVVNVTSGGGETGFFVIHEDGRD